MSQPTPKQQIKAWESAMRSHVKALRSMGPNACCERGCPCEHADDVIDLAREVYGEDSPEFEAVYLFANGAAA